MSPEKREPKETRPYITEWRKRKPATVHRYLVCAASCRLVYSRASRRKIGLGTGTRSHSDRHRGNPRSRLHVRRGELDLSGLHRQANVPQRLTVSRSAHNRDDANGGCGNTRVCRKGVFPTREVRDLHEIGEKRPLNYPKRRGRDQRPLRAANGRNRYGSDDTSSASREVV